MDALVKTYNALEISEFAGRVVTLETPQLLQIKNSLNDRYYNTGEDVIDDTKYDLIVEELTRRGSKLSVGCKLRDGDNAVNLPCYLGGMDKLKCGEDKKIETWFSKNKSASYIVSNKLNGVSCLAVFAGEDVKLYTRGDGKVGADISYLSKNIQGLPIIKPLSKPLSKLSVRGELIISDKDYLANPNKKKNCLATIIGLVNSKTLRESVNQLHFVAYEYITESFDNFTPSAGLQNLKKLGFEVVPYQLVNAVMNSNYLKDYLLDRKKDSIYDIDGLIIQGDGQYDRTHINASGNPTYAIAFKTNLEITDAEVVDVVWEISRYGIIKPQVKIVPTEICNITNVSLSGFNAKFIKDNVIGKGSIITITRSGDIIPYIMGIVKPSDNNKPLLPSYEYKWTDTGVDIYIDTTVENSERDIAQITHFFKTLEVKHISEGIIKKLHSQGYKTIKSILELNVKTLTSIGGIGEGVATRLMEVHTVLKHVKMSILLVASGVFEGFGSKRIETICERFNPLMDVITPDKLLTLKGISTVMTERFVQNLPSFKLFYNEIENFVGENFEHVEVKSGEYSDCVFVFSGFRDKHIEELIKSAGGEIGVAVTKTTTHLVVKDLCSTSGKIEKAKELGIKIISGDYF